MVVQQYILRTFTEYTNESGVALNESPALQILVNILSERFIEDYVNQKFHFLGESVTFFAIRLILAKEYSSYDDTMLNNIAKHFTNLSQLHKNIGKQTFLSDYVAKQNFSIVINNMLGVLYSYFGLPTIEKLLKPSVISIVDSQLHPTVKVKMTIDHPAYVLNQLINSNNGTFDTKADKTFDNHWKVTYICQLTKSSIVFCHARVAQNKQKARMEASRDILAFLDNQPDIFEQLKAPVDENQQQQPYILPIETSEYYYQSSPTTSTDGKQKILDVTDWTTNSPGNSVHISAEDNDAAMGRLSDLLLGTGMDVDVERNQRNKKRPRQSIFGLTETIAGNITNSPVKQNLQIPTLKEETIDMEITKNSILAAIQEPVQIQQNVTYTHDNSNSFDLFNNTTPNKGSHNSDAKAVQFFRSIFHGHRHLLKSTLDLPGQSKSTFLSLVKKYEEDVQVDIRTQTGGSSHDPIFFAEVALKSTKKPEIFLKTNGTARRKKDAEQAAFYELIALLAKELTN
ncbi:MAG: hypothetical protein EXX96DRAFT_648802 [Benjaminiella poitrasii]|nr:MAG: hypothetical protein EXX96DRAFT_648802 [Benjaminiella poitrasii]